MIRFASLLALLTLALTSLHTSPTAAAPAPAGFPPVIVDQGTVMGTLAGTTVTATMWDAGGTAVGSVTIDLLAAPYVTGGTTGTSLGDSIAFRGYYWGFPGVPGRIFAAAGYTGAIGFHVYELRWDAAGNVDGGWSEYR